MLLECPALADLRDEFELSPLVTNYSGVVARLVWASPWSAGTSLHAWIARHADDGPTLSNSSSLGGCQG